MSWRSWTGSTLTVLTACVLVPLAAGGCGTGEAHTGAVPPSPVGKVLDGTDENGRHLREVATRDAPGVGVEVTPDATGGWDVRLTPRHFRFSPSGVPRSAVPGRGLARLFVDGRPVTGLRTPRYHLPGRLVPHGTHHVTARLYADDGTVWAVRGRPVESTADITASGTESGAAPGGESGGESGAAPGTDS